MSKKLVCYEEVDSQAAPTLAGDIAQRADLEPFKAAIFVTTWLVVVGLLIYLYLRTRRTRS